MTASKINPVQQQIAVTASRGKNLPELKNGASKNDKPKTKPTKPQAEETLNPDLNSENDI